MNVFGLVVDATAVLLVLLVLLVVLTVLLSRKRIGRLTALVGQKVDQLIGLVDTPEMKIDRVYERKKEALLRLDEGLVKLMKAKNQLTQLCMMYEGKVGEIDGKLKTAVKENNREHAEYQLKTKKLYQQTIDKTKGQIEGLEKRLESTSKVREKAKLDLELFGSQREILESRLTVGGSINNIEHDLTGISGNGESGKELMNDVEDKIRGLESENSAIQELRDTGVLDSPVTSRTDEIDVSAELEELFRGK